MTSTLCSIGCGQPSETPMCRTCRSTLDRDLREIPTLLDEIEVTLTRRGKPSGGGVGFVTGTSVGAIPMDLGASAAGANLRDKLASWTADLWESYGPRWATCLGCGARCAGGHEEHQPAVEGIECRGRWEYRLDALDIAAHPLPLSRWILRHPNWVMAHSAAAELYDELTGAIRWVQDSVYGQGEPIYLGQCWAPVPLGDGIEGPLELCDAELSAPKGRREAACRSCGFRWNVAERRRWLLKEMENEVLTAADLSRALTAYVDQAVTPAMIRNYANRGRLVAAGHKVLGPNKQWPMYRVGDLLDILFATPAALEAS